MERGGAVVAVLVVVGVAGGLLTGHGGTVGAAVAVAVDVQVVGAAVHGVHVHGTIAVVVHAVAALGGRGADRRAGVVAVSSQQHMARGLFAGGHQAADGTVAVTVRIGVPGQGVDGRVVHRTVAVVVGAIAQLRRSGVVLGDAVVTVAGVMDVVGDDEAGQGRDIGVAVAVAVRVPVPAGGIHGVVLVGDAVTVVVHAVTELGAHGGITDHAVVAVVGAGHEAAGAGAGGGGLLGGAVAVAVHVGVPEGGIQGVVLVDDAVAVVVHAVTQLAGPGADGGVRVVAVAAICHEAGGGLAGLRGPGGVAIAVHVAVGVPEQGVEGRVVHQAVAVVVHAVTQLVRTGVARGVAVVAVGGQGRRHVAAGSLDLEHPGKGVAVAVAVHVGMPGLGLLDDLPALLADEAGLGAAGGVVPAGGGGEAVEPGTVLARNVPTRAVPMPVDVGDGAAVLPGPGPFPVPIVEAQPPLVAGVVRVQAGGRPLAVAHMSRPLHPRLFGELGIDERLLVSVGDGQQVVVLGRTGCLGLHPVVAVCAEQVAAPLVVLLLAASGGEARRHAVELSLTASRAPALDGGVAVAVAPPLAGAQHHEPDNHRSGSAITTEVRTLHMASTRPGVRHARTPLPRRRVGEQRPPTADPSAAWSPRSCLGSSNSPNGR